jgi:hypothetical protein
MHTVKYFADGTFPRYFTVCIAYQHIYIVCVCVYIYIYIYSTICVDSASNRNEYQEHFLGVKAAGA